MRSLKTCKLGCIKDVLGRVFFRIGGREEW